MTSIPPRCVRKDRRKKVNSQLQCGGSYLALPQCMIIRVVSKCIPYISLAALYIVELKSGLSCLITQKY